MNSVDTSQALVARVSGAAPPLGKDLSDPRQIRCRSAAITQWVEAGQSSHWTLDRDRLDAAARLVARITHERFPDLRVPLHSRWRHFEAGGVDRSGQLARRLVGTDSPPPAVVTGGLAARIDLCVVSVLLDAGAGPHWRFVDSAGRVHRRSEALAVASFEAFMQGLFSGTPSSPLRADTACLETLTARELAQALQHQEANPLAGIEGRTALLNRLGGTLRAQGLERPADLYRPLLQPVMAARYDLSPDATRPAIDATDLLQATVRGLGPVWPLARESPDGIRGDLWPHPAAQDETAEAGASPGWVPFHKLSQWLCYSLIEPIREAGLQVTGLEALTGLPEYRNGGLLVDTGVLRLRDPSAARRIWTPGDELVIEWRAMTVNLLDKLGVEVRALLGESARHLPLASILEGGSWAAGRRLAAERRDGRPPIEVDSGASVF